MQAAINTQEVERHFISTNDLELMELGRSVGFEVIDEAPAKDLEEFIRMGYVESLDTDVSPGPTMDGNYLVFVEFNRDKSFPLTFLKGYNFFYIFPVF